MLRDLTQKVGKKFGVLEVLAPEFLDECRRTSFTWTKQQWALCLAVDKKYFSQALTNNNIKGIIAPPTAVIEKSRYNKSIIIAESPRDLFYYVHNQSIHLNFEWRKEPVSRQIAKSAHLHPTALIGEKVYIGGNAVVSAHSVIMENSVIDENTVIHPCAIVGINGLYSKVVDGERVHVKHHGGVRVGKNCILHAGSVVVRSANYGEFTIVGNNVHLGIHSSIGHDCDVGDDCQISGGVVFSGRVRMGKGVWVGAGAIVSNALTIGDSASVRIGSVVVENVPAGGDVSGNFALDHQRHIKNFIRSKG